MARSTHHPKVTLTAPVYALEEPVTGQYIAARGATPKLVPLHLATICPVRPECFNALARTASQKLAGIPHEIVRVEA